MELAHPESNTHRVAGAALLCHGQDLDAQEEEQADDVGERQHPATSLELQREHEAAHIRDPDSRR
jgi:hypothetical protein